MKTNAPIGITESLAEIMRRFGPSFEELETRLAEKMKPARLSPLISSRSSGEYNGPDRTEDK